MNSENTSTVALASGAVLALVRDVRLPGLPYSKTDSVADLDAPRAVTPKPPRPAVPGRACPQSKLCDLRKHGKCDALHCSTAADFIVNAGSTGQEPA